FTRQPEAGNQFGNFLQKNSKRAAKQVFVLVLILVLDRTTRFWRTRTTTRTIQFMVPMRGGRNVEALHEPAPSPHPLPLQGGEGARRAGEGAVHGPNARWQKRGGSP